MFCKSRPAGGSGMAASVLREWAGEIFGHGEDCHFNQGLFPSERSDATFIGLEVSLPPIRSPMHGESYSTHEGISSFPWWASPQVQGELSTACPRAAPLPHASRWAGSGQLVPGMMAHDPDSPESPVRVREDIFPPVRGGTRTSSWFYVSEPGLKPVRPIHGMCRAAMGCAGIESMSIPGRLRHGHLCAIPAHQAQLAEHAQEFPVQPGALLTGPARSRKREGIRGVRPVAVESKPARVSGETMPFPAVSGACESRVLSISTPCHRPHGPAAGHARSGSRLPCRRAPTSRRPAALRSRHRILHRP